MSKLFERDTSVATLHSNLVLFKFWCWLPVLPVWCLYIPIWFYSNGATVGGAIGQLIFTFQSGSIQITWNRCSSFTKFHFTFQSGSIQIQKQPREIFFELIFTFQSGSIQIGNAPDYSFIYAHFTFQSGSIQMSQNCRSLPQYLYLYIPIWFYSNLLNC